MSEKMTTFSLDLEKILLPISSQQPAGDYLKYEGTYDLIENARREEDADLPMGIWASPVKKADWEQVRDLCIESLETRTKDIQIACWLFEALLKLYGYHGILEGLHLLKALSETFWETMYPPLEEDSFEYRISPLIWLNDKMTLKIKMIPLTRPETDKDYTYCWADWESALYYERLNLQRKKPGTEPKNMISRARFLTGVTLTGIQYYQELAAIIDQILDEFRQLEYQLQDKIGNGAPSFHTFKSILNDIRKFVRQTLDERREEISENDEPSSEMSMESDQNEMVSSGKETPRTFRTIRSRADAYLALSEAAEFLLRTEPHSPVPYLIKRAIVWGSMPLSDVLHELVETEPKLKEIYKLLGINESR